MSTSEDTELAALTAMLGSAGVPCGSSACCGRFATRSNETFIRHRPQDTHNQARCDGCYQDTTERIGYDLWPVELRQAKLVRRFEKLLFKGDRP